LDEVEIEEITKLIEYKLNDEFKYHELPYRENYIKLLNKLRDNLKEAL
jgi:hypothetical protein